MFLYSNKKEINTILAETSAFVLSRALKTCLAVLTGTTLLRQFQRVPTKSVLEQKEQNIS